MLLEVLNVESPDPVMNYFCNIYNLFSLVKEPTCFKNFYYLSCINLFLTNCPRSFENTVTIETGLSVFHKMVITVLKVFLQKSRNQKSFNTGAVKTLRIKYFRENWIVNYWILERKVPKVYKSL